MACSAPHMSSLPWTSSMKLLPHSFVRPNSTHSFCSYSRSRMSSCLSLSASLNSTFQSDLEINNACSTLRELCEGHVPDHVLRRAEEVGYVEPTPVQNEALPVLFSGRDCVIHAQTGSGKTLAYLLLIFSVINAQRSSVQAVIVVPTRELGMQVTKVARVLAAKALQLENEQKSCTIMALLDDGTLRRHKSWLKVEPPAIVIATLRSLCQMLDKYFLKLDALRVLVIDEVDFMFNSSKEVSSLKKLLTIYSSINSRQTIFASASIPQHKRFVYDCIQQKWTKSNVVHIHVNPIEPMPSCLHHRYVICGNREKYSTLLQLLQLDAPQSAIIFVGEQSEKSKKAGNGPPTNLVTEFLKTSYGGSLELVLLEEDMNFNQRATSITWSVEAWEKIKFFFPENNNRSRIVITTRQSELADYFASSALVLGFLDDKNSWELFCMKTFTKKGCPAQLEQVGKKIVCDWGHPSKFTKGTRILGETRTR